MPGLEAGDYLIRVNRQPVARDQVLQERMIPFFVECLDQEDHTGHMGYRITMRAADGLRLYGADAEQALPALRRALNQNWAHRAHFVPDHIRGAINHIERAVERREQD